MKKVQLTGPNFGGENEALSFGNTRFWNKNPEATET
jgi:hypothetical protein